MEQHREQLEKVKNTRIIKYDYEYRPLEACKLLQFSIDLWRRRIVHFRTNSSPESEIVRKAVRCAQSVCLQYTARQIYHRRKAASQGDYHDELESYPQLECWLEVVGLTNDGAESIKELTAGNFDRLLETTDDQIRDALCDAGAKDREHLTVALRNLRMIENRYLTTDYPAGKFIDYEEDLSWEYLGKTGDPLAKPGIPLNATAAEIPSEPSLRCATKTPPIPRKTSAYPGFAEGVTGTKSRLDQLRSDRGQGHRYARRRLQTEPTPGSTELSSPSRSPSYATSPDASSDAYLTSDSERTRHPSQQCDPTSQSLPLSPRLPSMNHEMRHRFSPFVKVTNCQQCDKPMFFGYKCRECKFRCHRDCVEKVPPTCALLNELLDAVARRYQQGAFENLNSPLGSHSPSAGRFAKHAYAGFSRGWSSQHAGDSSSTTSSCASSAPGSPQVMVGLIGSKFKFPVQENLRRGSEERQSQGDLSIRGDVKNGSITDSEQTIVSGNSNSESVCLSSREWDIPLDEVVLEERLGEGQFGVVYRGNWHGAVAVKMLNMETASPRRQAGIMATFEQEVANFRKTRHENLVLFMGACVKPPNLAIVTSLCKGLTLYRHLHYQTDKFNHNRIGSIARQICLGMGYLHARGILHKDLKTKNIFYENGKVVITDFGLFSVAKLCQEGRRGNYLTIPRGWLYYLAPELLKDLRPGIEHPDLSFSTRSDVYAFGTVFFELLTGTWPFQDQPPESIIYLVSKGIKPPLANLYSIVEYKDILMSCWAYQDHDRPDFTRLQSHLERLPKRKLSRSPSQPTDVTRSNESTF
ncbi:kinase suppressor of Ras 1 [Galendromus occidentalis]|uniref:Kinase suppressor of Ras 1 n=1 Tax=Galendromus occidentalis TaxID=34638 RepID=A0AAJ7SGF7_9ACAR|nr:kinase suppressor of Ras 1 [Galendromus occidentalis]